MNGLVHLVSGHPGAAPYSVFDAGGGGAGELRGIVFFIAAPIVLWWSPHVSADTLALAHNAARKLGHFFIPALAFWTLVIGPLRNRPIV